MLEKFSFRVWQVNTIAFHAELLRIEKEAKPNPLSKSDCINLYILKTLPLLKQHRGELKTVETVMTLLESAKKRGVNALDEYFTCPKDALKHAYKIKDLPCLEDDTFQCVNEECQKTLREKLTLS